MDDIVGQRFERTLLDSEMRPSRQLIEALLREAKELHRLYTSCAGRVTGRDRQLLVEAAEGVIDVVFHLRGASRTEATIATQTIRTESARLSASMAGDAALLSPVDIGRTIRDAVAASS